LDELKTITKTFSEISLNQLIAWSTWNGAEYLGFQEKLGSLEIGKTPGINQLLNIENDRITMQSTLNKIL